MLPVFPVYPFSLCVSESTHEGALPGPAYPYFKNNRSTEVHTVMWIPGPWVKKTGSVLGDANVLMLEGHDTGMMIPHISPLMDNLLPHPPFVDDPQQLPEVASGWIDSGTVSKPAAGLRFQSGASPGMRFDGLAAGIPIELHGFAAEGMITTSLPYELLAGLDVVVDGERVPNDVVELGEGAE